MAANLLIMENANLFCGDDDPESGKHLTLEELQLPEFQSEFVDHMPGGSRIGIEIEVGMNKLEPTFKLKGFDMPLLRQFGLGSEARTKYTAYGAIRNKRSGLLIECKAVMEGKIGKISPEAFQRGEAMSHDYSINEVTHYEFWMDNVEEFYWDFFTNDLRVGGVNKNQRMNQILRIAN